jgi:hypothetical protein
LAFDARQYEQATKGVMMMLFFILNQFVAIFNPILLMRRVLLSRSASIFLVHAEMRTRQASLRCPRRNPRRKDKTEVIPANSMKLFVLSTCCEVGVSLLVGLAC